MCSATRAGRGRPRTDQDLRGDAHRRAGRACRALRRRADAEGRDRHLRRPAGGGGATDAEDIDRLLLSLAAEMPASKAAAEAARMTGGQKPALYRRLLELQGDARMTDAVGQALQGLPARPSRRVAGGARADGQGLSHRRAALPDEARRDRPDRPARRPGADRRGQGAADADGGDGGDRPRIRAAHRGRRRSLAVAPAGLRRACRCASTWWRCCRGAGRCMCENVFQGGS